MDCLVESCIFDLQNVVDEIEKLEKEKQELMDIINIRFDNEKDILKCHEIYSALPECALRYKLFKKITNRTEEMSKQIMAVHGIDIDKLDLMSLNIDKILNDAIQFRKENGLEVDMTNVRAENIDNDFK